MPKRHFLGGYFRQNVVSNAETAFLTKTMTLRKIEKIVTNAVSALLTTLKKNDIFQFLFTSNFLLVKS